MTTAGPSTAAAESIFIDLVNTLANAGLRLDPLSESRLRALEGRCVHLITRLPAAGEKIFSLLVNDGRLELVPYAIPQPNAIARGSMTDMLGWIARGPGPSAGISFEGDETVLQELSDIFRAYRPDLSEPVAEVLGHELTAGLFNVVEGAAAALRSAAQGAGSALQQGTAQHYVTRKSLNAFLDVLDDTRARVDRLTQRVAAEEARAAGDDS